MIDEINIELLIEEINKSHVIWMLQAKIIAIKIKKNMDGYSLKICE